MAVVSYLDSKVLCQPVMIDVHSSTLNDDTTFSVQIETVPRLHTHVDSFFFFLEKKSKVFVQKRGRGVLKIEELSKQVFFDKIRWFL